MSFRRSLMGLQVLFLLLAPRMAAQELTAFVPEHTEAIPAVIVCPGGSYHWLDWENEGTRVAQWLSDNGIAAFVLRYRVAGVGDFLFRYRYLFRGHVYPDMLQDVQGAIASLRSAADSLGLDPHRLGVMGFSAGGHLAMMSGIFWQGRPELRPDFVAPIYPVVTLTDERYVHRRSRRGLIGEKRQRDPHFRRYLSLEQQIRGEEPPVFLLNCVDDPVVDYHNAVLLDSALTCHGVPHLYTQYPSGGHGFGAAPEKQNAYTARWQALFLAWLRSSVPAAAQKHPRIAIDQGQKAE